MSPRGLDVAGTALRAAAVAWLFARVMLFIALALGTFLVAFLGYFTVPFLLLGVALLLLAGGDALRRTTRPRASRRR